MLASSDTPFSTQRTACGQLRRSPSDEADRSILRDACDSGGPAIHRRSAVPGLPAAAGEPVGPSFLTWERDGQVRMP